jgi:hypothetical protein
MSCRIVRVQRITTLKVRCHETIARTYQERPRLSRIGYSRTIAPLDQIKLLRLRGTVLSCRESLVRSYPF